jgi:AraC family transcriptional regulator of adaptative response/methylated-DNA-[protein]-cysteine methyltransferase
MARLSGLTEDALMYAMPESLDDTRFAAVLARDPAPACGAFLYAVTSQGIHRRHRCAAIRVSSPIARRRKTPAFAPASAATRAVIVRACKPKRCAPPVP